jgi:hypothetical protein
MIYLRIPYIGYKNPIHVAFVGKSVENALYQFFQREKRPFNLFPGFPY